MGLDIVVEKLLHKMMLYTLQSYYMVDVGVTIGIYEKPLVVGGQIRDKR